MKISDEDAAGEPLNGSKDPENIDLEDDLFKLPLCPRQSISWDIQIVDAVFEKFKRESSTNEPAITYDEPEPKKAPVPIVIEPIPDLGSTYLTVPGDVAPSPLLSYKHSSNLKDRRKSRIQVLSSDTTDNEEDKPTTPVKKQRESKVGNCI